jgi:hypothetical protein
LLTLGTILAWYKSIEGKPLKAADLIRQVNTLKKGVSDVSHNKYLPESLRILDNCKRCYLNADGEVANGKHNDRFKVPQSAPEEAPEGRDEDGADDRLYYEN